MAEIEKLENLKEVLIYLAGDKLAESSELYREIESIEREICELRFELAEQMQAVQAIAA